MPVGSRRWAITDKMRAMETVDIKFRGNDARPRLLARTANQPQITLRATQAFRTAGQIIFAIASTPYSVVTSFLEAGEARAQCCG